MSVKPLGRLLACLLLTLAALGSVTATVPAGMPVWFQDVNGSPTSTLLVAESGTWTVQPGNTANTTAWKVDGSAVTQPVSGTFWQATQPVSGTFWQATQPVSGTVTANAGTGTLTVSKDLTTGRAVVMKTGSATTTS